LWDAKIAGQEVPGPLGDDAQRDGRLSQHLDHLEHGAIATDRHNDIDLVLHGPGGALPEMQSVSPS